MSRIVGIDLGTTNSLVAYVDDETGLPRVIPDRDGQVLLPSIVSFTRDGVLVGTAAKRQLVRRVVLNIEHIMCAGNRIVYENQMFGCAFDWNWSQSVEGLFTTSSAFGVSVNYAVGFARDTRAIGEHLRVLSGELCRVRTSLHHSISKSHF